MSCSSYGVLTFGDRNKTSEKTELPLAPSQMRGCVLRRFEGVLLIGEMRASQPPLCYSREPELRGQDPPQRAAGKRSSVEILRLKSQFPLWQMMLLVYKNND